MAGATVTACSRSSSAASRAGPYLVCRRSASTRSAMPSLVRVGLADGREEWSSRPSSPCVRHRAYHFARQRREIPASAAMCAMGRPASTRRHNRRRSSGARGAFACTVMTHRVPQLVLRHTGLRSYRAGSSSSPGVGRARRDRASRPWTCPPGIRPRTAPPSGAAGTPVRRGTGRPGPRWRGWRAGRPPSPRPGRLPASPARRRTRW